MKNNRVASTGSSGKGTLTPGTQTWSMHRFGRVLLSTVLLVIFSSPGADVSVLADAGTSSRDALFSSTSVGILVDDFVSQPFNRLHGDRGSLNDSVLDSGSGQLKISIAPGRTWGGVWEKLNRPVSAGGKINFSAILPAGISRDYQSQITGISVEIAEATPGRNFKMEFKDAGTIRWNFATPLTGGQQVIQQTLPSLGNINELTLFLDNALPGEYVTVERISLTASLPAKLAGDPAMAAFVWSYSMLLENWNPVTGLVRDKGRDPSGIFDAIQATGSLAAATALAEQLGVISRMDAVLVVSKIGDTLLNGVPRHHGIWPHWVKVENGAINIVPGTEWSSLDTLIAAIGLLDAQHALGLDTSATEQMLKGIDWNGLVSPDGISHGYYDGGSLISTRWDTFGGESWLAALGYAAATGKVAPINAGDPLTANGSGFIDELAWLFVRPPSKPDIWNTNWPAYRATAADTQISYYLYSPALCFYQHHLFGLSAAEVPVPGGGEYQAFGVGGRYTGPNDGSVPVGAPVVVPHYSAMIASLSAADAIGMWSWLVDQGYFSPLNNVESLMFKPADSGCGSEAGFNELKGSWNLSLQTLGWGNYVSQRQGQTPSPWLATSQNSFLRKGYLTLVEDGLPPGPDLDEDATQWNVFTEGSPTWAMDNVHEPSLDGRSLRCAITGGAPYSNVHCYRNLPARPAANAFVMTTSFYYQPASTFNNVGGPSTVQALEFTMNKWDQGIRYEWALQWDNVDSGAPKWRYWGRTSPTGPLTWVDLGITGSLAGKEWHTLKIEGQILNGQVHYQRFAFDGQMYLIDKKVTPASTPGETDRLAVAVQLDGNSTETPYELFLDHLVLQAPTFADVPLTNPYWQDIEILYVNGLTGGCGTNPLRFCPDQIMDRAQSAVFMVRGAYGAGYVPNPTAYKFKDNWSTVLYARPWAEAMREANLTTGCKASPLLYCPLTKLNREQAVIFGLKMKYGMYYLPPPATGTVFADMTNPNYYAAPWVEKAYADGLITACGTASNGKPKFCPSVLVTRGLGSYIIVRAKNLSMP